MVSSLFAPASRSADQPPSAQSFAKGRALQRHRARCSEETLLRRKQPGIQTAHGRYVAVLLWNESSGVSETRSRRRTSSWRRRSGPPGYFISHGAGAEELCFFHVAGKGK